MNKTWQILLLSILVGASNVFAAELVGRDAVVLGAFLNELRVVDDAHYGAHPVVARDFFNEVFDAKSCELPDSPFKRGSLRIQSGHIYCLYSDKATWDSACWAENPSKTKKLPLHGKDAYLLISLLKEANTPTTPNGTSNSMATYSVECTYEGVQNCLGNDRKAAVCVIR